jgi:nicotinamidase-related amidase
MKNALLIIDMQNDFVLPSGVARIPNAYETIPAIYRILSFFRKGKLPVFHVIRQYRADGSDIEISRRDAFMTGPKYVVPGSHGAQIVDELRPAEDEYVIIKPRFSAFFGTELDLILRRLHVERVVICGTQYPNCIRATAFDSLSYGYDTVVILEGTSAASPEVATANIHDLRKVGVRCISLSEFENEA